MAHVVTKNTHSIVAGKSTDVTIKTKWKPIEENCVLRHTSLSSVSQQPFSWEQLAGATNVLCLLVVFLFQLVLFEHFQALRHLGRSHRFFSTDFLQRVLIDSPAHEFPLGNLWLRPDGTL